MTDRTLSAIVLAAGAGTRMRSTLPKPLHRLAGRSMLRYVLDSLADCSVARVVVVVGHGGDRVRAEVESDDLGLDLGFAVQVHQDGTGDATSVGLTELPDAEGPDDEDHDVIVLAGDMPLLRPSTIAALVESHRQDDAACTILTAVVPEPGSYGRIIRGADGEVLRIVEAADLAPEEVDVDEINTAVYCFRRSVLAPALRKISRANAQGELYLTDVVAVLREAGYRIGAVTVGDAAEGEGINDRAQLAAAEAEIRRRTNEALMRSGVAMIDPASTYVDTTVTVAPDATILPGTVLEGMTVIGAGAVIGPGTRLVDCTVGGDAIVEQSNGRGASIGDGAVVGPFAVLRAGDVVASGAADPQS